MAGPQIVRGISVALLILCGPLHSKAQSVWNGAGNNDNWTTAQNWVGGTAPSSGSNAWIRLQGTVRPTPLVDLNTPWVLNRLEFENHASGAPNSFILSGNQLSFQGTGPTIYNYAGSGQTINNDIDLPQSDLTLDSLTGKSITFNGHISGSGGLRIALQAIINSSNTYQGTTTIGITPETGQIILTHPQGLGSTVGGTIMQGSSSILLSGGITVDPEPLSLTANGYGNGLVNYSGNNTWTGNITVVGGGGISSKNAGETFTITGAIDGGNAGLQVGGAGDIIISGPITNMPSKSFDKYGTGTLTLNGTNTMASILVEDGAFVVPNQKAVPSNAYIQLNPNTGNYYINAYPTLRIQEDLTIRGLRGVPSGAAGMPIVDLGSNNLTINLDSGFASFGGNFLGTGSLIKSGVGVLELAVLNQYSGKIFINGGAVRIYQDSDLGSVPETPTERLILNGGSLEALSYNSVILDANRIIRLEGAGQLTSYLNTSNSFNVLGQITGPGALSTTGPLIRLSNLNNDYSGGTNLLSGILQFDNLGSIGGSGPNVSIASGAIAAAGYPIDQTFLSRIDPTSQGIVGLSVTSGNNLDFGVAGLTSIYLGAVGTQTFSGTLAPANGVYRLGGSTGTLELTKPNAISGAASLLVGYLPTSSGTIILSGDNYLAGNVTVDSGTLKVNGATLGFAETDVKATLLLANGTLTGSKVTVHQNGLLTGCGTINAELVNDGKVSVNCGDLRVNGNVTNNGTMIIYGGGALFANQSFINNGVLDLLTSPNTALPPGFVNNGTVVYFGDVKTRSTSMSGTLFTLVVQSFSGHNYQLQRSPILPATNWVNVGIAKPGTGSDLVLTDNSAVGSRMFYRVQVSP